MTCDRPDALTRRDILNIHAGPDADRNRLYGMAELLVVKIDSAVMLTTVGTKLATVPI